MLTNHEFNQKLINAIAEKIPKKSEQLVLIVNLLSLGKEAAYRRLRGSVPFSFAEACLIAQKLNISLTTIVNNNQGQKPIFELEITPQNVIDYYTKRLENYEKYYENIKGIDNLKVFSACNTIPDAFFLQFQNLFKLRIVRLIYQI